MIVDETTPGDRQRQKQLDAAKHQEFVDWKFREWLTSQGSHLVFNFEGDESLTLDARHQLGCAVIELLKSAFRAGARQ